MGGMLGKRGGILIMNLVPLILCGELLLKLLDFLPLQTVDYSGGVMYLIGTLKFNIK